jgi:hypothetical protein
VTVQSALVVEANDRDQRKRQGIKLRKRGESKRDARVIWREEWYVWHCEGDLFEFIKNSDRDHILREYRACKQKECI